MQTNMSSLTDVDMHDQFAKPQSNGTALLKKRTLPQNTAFRHTAVFCSNNVKQQAGKAKFQKNRTANIQMFKAVGCNQITFPATRSTT